MGDIRLHRRLRQISMSEKPGQLAFSLFFRGKGIPESGQCLILGSFLVGPLHQRTESGCLTDNVRMQGTDKAVAKSGFLPGVPDEERHVFLVHLIGEPVGRHLPERKRLPVKRSMFLRETSPQSESGNDIFHIGRHIQTQLAPERFGQLRQRTGRQQFIGQCHIIRIRRTDSRIGMDGQPFFGVKD